MRNSVTRGAAMAAATIFAGATLAATAAQATVVRDPLGDRLDSFHNTTEDTPDLDVVRVSARYTKSKLILSATMAGDIGTSDAGEYVWGIDRGQGSPLLSEINPLTDTTDPIGSNVPFDAFIILGNGVVSDEHDVNSGGFGVLLTPYDAVHHDIGVTGTFGIDPGLVKISGRRITLTLDRSALPSTGFDFTDFTYNIWPRYGKAGDGNVAVTDLAPDNENIKASAAVPEAATWAFMIFGFGLAGTALRRRHLLPAA